MTSTRAEPERYRAAHVAKAAAGRPPRPARPGTASRSTAAIGYTWEHDLHLFLRRASADECLLGPTGWHLDRLADLLFSP